MMFSKVFEFLKREMNKNNETMKDLNVRLLLLSDCLEKVVYICNELEENFVMVDTENIKIVINNLDFIDINDFDLEELEKVKRIYEFLNDPQLPNVGIKKEKLLFIKNFKNKLLDLKEDISKNISDGKSNLDYLKSINDRCYYYSSKLDDEFGVRESVVEINKLFEFLDELSIDKTILLDVIYGIMSVRFNSVKGGN